MTFFLSLWFCHIGWGIFTRSFEYSHDSFVIAMLHYRWKSKTESWRFVWTGGNPFNESAEPTHCTLEYHHSTNYERKGWALQAPLRRI